jgi:alkanesulfonate monooxygenase SsuD/methylene tetrahydromethanopterin reductase-like flavin-dependent oxidoreductase (luciferase family)
VTLRQVARYADACNLGDFGKVSGTGNREGIARKLAVLRRHCEALGRPYESVLRTHLTGWLVLAEDEASLRAKVERYIPEGPEQRFAGEWAGFAFVGTPEQAVTHYRALAETGIQYFIVQILDAADEETIRLLAQTVVPAVRF